MSHGQPDGEPTVCATTNFDQAIFRAIIHRTRDRAAGRSHYSAWSGSASETIFMTLRQSFEVLTGDERGYVYVLSSGYFKPYRGEMRSMAVVVPEVVIEVRVNDLPKNIRLFDSTEDLVAFQGSLKRQEGWGTIGNGAEGCSISE